ncbi:MAG: HAMP domain-containing histidine kinase [Hungatella sp.]|jgi:signal transduction histidine kinase|nr:HAMP domain-containing histidine kinase [Hungatella sp.]
MKKDIWPVSLKKQFLLLLHAAFLMLFLWGISFIYFNENYGRGIRWIREESYADTLPFTEQLEADVEMIFKYVKYKDLFETDGKLDYNKDMVCVTFSSGKSMIYTLNDMIREAKSRGYYLTDTFEVAGGPAVHERDTQNAAIPLIEWKTYDPHASEHYTEPGDAYATREELAVEVLTILGEYYQIQYNYMDRPSNLYFRVSYMDGMGQERLYTNAEQYLVEDLMGFGRYLYLSGDSILIDTNLKYIPGNITSELENYNLYGNNDYYIVLGLNTRYPNTDPYSRAHDAYTRVRVNYITGLLLFAIGAAGLLVTLACLSYLSGYETLDRSVVALAHFDGIPVECGVVLCLLCLWFCHVVTGKAGGKLANLLLDERHRNFFVVITRWTTAYLVGLVEGFSLLRQYKARVLWHNSLACRGWRWCVAALNNASFPVEMTACFLGYLGGNGALIYAIYYLYGNRELLPVPFVYLIPAAVLVFFQVWTFLLLYRRSAETEKISYAIFKMSEGDTSYKIDTLGFSGKGAGLAQTLNNLGDGLETALQEKVKSERLKADLITNVSHDIKTPLTSIINYVDLLKREKLPDEKIQRYLEVLDQKSQRLKTLTEDLVEASKASSGNLKLEMANIDLVEMIHQTNGEFEEKFGLRHLELVASLPPETILIAADGRRLWRVLENLYNNTFKYAMEHSRVYVDLEKKNGYAYFTIKNVSQNPLNINADELTERFVRGDVARTTDGSGLGLSIAKSLTLLQGGTFDLYIDGDLFKAQVGFPVLSD